MPIKKVHFVYKFKGTEMTRDAINFDSDLGPVEEQFWDALPPDYGTEKSGPYWG